ncbi:hypothetical protein HBN50_03905 [Halobacteriovorax sp. GB3]|uniref:hypothetical protein n=1 Tax=Halobacteriovorax sp. GB3 TaxID=2719615 RepID=UPI0023606EB9|nr:hypothetical protein [Halobacteriovorax sp. GB3]MDD0852224.1 hypothetical protein [Halobacteriovorax sp. GB3]
MSNITSINRQDVQLDAYFSNEMGEGELLFIHSLDNQKEQWHRDLSCMSHRYGVAATLRSQSENALAVNHHIQDYLSDLVETCKQTGLIRPLIVASGASVYLACEAVTRGLIQASGLILVDSDFELKKLSQLCPEIAQKIEESFKGEEPLCYRDLTIPVALVENCHNKLEQNALLFNSNTSKGHYFNGLDYPLTHENEEEFWALMESFFL